MKLRIMSDLHIDHRPGWLIPTMEGEDRQILVLAGDIANGIRITDFDYFWRNCVGRFYHIILVLGNHDYWGTDLVAYEDYRRYFKNMFPKGKITLLQNNKIDVSNMLFAGTTLWTDYGGANPAKMQLAKRYMRDYVAIRGACGGNLTPEEVLEHHKEAADFVDNAAKTRAFDKPNILITHHMPNASFVAPRWVNDSGNCFFHANIGWRALGEFDLVICGHTHDTMDFVDPWWGTRCIINPLGYGQENQYGFNPFLVVEL